MRARNLVIALLAGSGVVGCLALPVSIHGGGGPAATGQGGPAASTARLLVEVASGGDLVSVLEATRGSRAGRVDRLGVEIVSLPPGADVPAVLARVRRMPGVLRAEEDFVAFAAAEAPPTDPDFGRQWGLARVQASRAWGEPAGIATDSVRIAVLDTGIDQDHPDLDAKVASASAGTYAAGNCGGKDQCNFTSSPGIDDLYGHGTHVAGIAAAVTNNGLGIAGAGYLADLMSGKVLSDQGWGYYSWIANGIIWAADSGAQVITLSLGGYSYSSFLASAVDYAWSKGAVLTAAAGNNGSSAKLYPAALDKVIAVAATGTDLADYKASFSNYGKWVDVAAPGVDIYSTLPNHANAFGTLGYGYLSGTSMATPFVAGEAALVRHRLAYDLHRLPSNSEVRARVERSCKRTPGTGRLYRWGRIDLYNAVTGSGLQ